MGMYRGWGHYPSLCIFPVLFCLGLLKEAEPCLVSAAVLHILLHLMILVPRQYSSPLLVI